MNVEILVNHYHLLDKDYKPNDLVVMDQNEHNFHKYIDSSLKPEISRTILPYFQKMQKDMQKEELYIIVDSGYRSYSYQEKVLQDNINKMGMDKALKLVAPPGASEHQLGLAIDIALMRNGLYYDDVTENDPEVLWLKEQAYKYGFILRYPKNKERVTNYHFEPWHYRFVGLRLSYILKYFDITLEEYYEKKVVYDNLYNDMNQKDLEKGKKRY